MCVCLCVCVLFHGNIDIDNSEALCHFSFCLFYEMSEVIPLRFYASLVSVFAVRVVFAVVQTSIGTEVIFNALQSQKGTLVR